MRGTPREVAALTAQALAATDAQIDTLAVVTSPVAMADAMRSAAHGALLAHVPHRLTKRYTEEVAAAAPARRHPVIRPESCHVSPPAGGR